MVGECARLVCCNPCRRCIYIQNSFFDWIYLILHPIIRSGFGTAENSTRHWCLYISALGTGASLQHRGVCQNNTPLHHTHRIRSTARDILSNTKCTAATERRLVGGKAERELRASRCRLCLLPSFITVYEFVMHQFMWENIFTDWLLQSLFVPQLFLKTLSW